jgi:hypothetical protein
MNKALKNSSKVKISRYHIDKIVENFIKRVSAKDTVLAIKLNRNTINRYYQEIRRSITKAERDRFESLIFNQKPILEFEWVYIDSDNTEDFLSFYLYSFQNRYLYLSRKNNSFSGLSKFVIKEDCFKPQYLKVLKKELPDTAYELIEKLCQKIFLQVRLYNSTLFEQMTEEVFRINVQADDSKLTKKYMKDIFREYPLFQ